MRGASWRGTGENRVKSTGRERRHARTRQAILDAAQEIIAERGPEGLSMREIANRIEYSPSGLYEIIDALCTEGFERLSARIRQRATGPTPTQRLAEGMVAYLDFASQHPEHYLLMFGHRPDSDIHLSLKQVGRNSAYGLLKQAIQDGIDTHEFKTREGYGLEEITYSCWALLHGIVTLRLTLFSKEGSDFDEFNRKVVEQTIENLRIV